MAKIIDGREISSSIREEIKERVKKLASKGIKPGLGVVLAGSDPGSQVYVRMKERACEELGILSIAHRVPDDITQDEVLKLVQDFNNNPEIHGILVQHPLPSHIDEPFIFESIDPSKDADGFHPYNQGKILLGDNRFIPCTPHGVLEMLVRSGYTASGKNVVIVGRSNIVGRPLAALLVQKSKYANATVTICHSRTKNLSEITRTADILVAAIGVPEFIKGDMVKEGAVVIDVGMNRVDDSSKERGYRLTGDVLFDEVEPKAEAITPVPGGVGPMTITMLMHNTVLSAERIAEQ